MTTLTLHHLDGRQFARGDFFNYVGFGWQWVCDQIQQEFGASPWAEVHCVEPPEDATEPGDIITLDGVPVARCNFVASLH